MTQNNNYTNINSLWFPLFITASVTSVVLLACFVIAVSRACCLHRDKKSLYTDLFREEKRGDRYKRKFGKVKDEFTELEDDYFALQDVLNKNANNIKVGAQVLAARRLQDRARRAQALFNDANEELLEATGASIPSAQV